eukprot:322362-Chlamydomonas_euryale.AAC.1
MQRVIRWGKHVAGLRPARGGRVLASDMHDPRIVYGFHHEKMCNMVRRHYGMAVKKTVALTMAEMKSGHRFVDSGSGRGLLMAAALSLGNTSGGRRPRTLAALRVRDCTVVVQRVDVG